MINIVLVLIQSASNNVINSIKVNLKNIENSLTNYGP